MEDIDVVINSIKLPISLPEEAFIKAGKNKLIADFELVFEHLPKELGEIINMNGTSSRVSPDTYQLKLTCAGFILIKIKDNQIVELSRIA